MNTALDTLNLIADNAGIARYTGWAMPSRSGHRNVTRYSYNGLHLVVTTDLVPGFQGRYDERIVAVREIESRWEGQAVFRPDWVALEHNFGEAWQAQPFALLGWAVEALQRMAGDKARDDMRDEILAQRERRETQARRQRNRVRAARARQLAQRAS